jgi:hypothetical protein
MAAFSGFYESHGPTPLSDARGIVLVHRHSHCNGQQRGHILHRVLFSVALAAIRAILSKWSPDSGI